MREKILSTLSVLLLFLKARRRVPQLYAAAEGVSKSVLGALQSTLYFKVTPEEKIWIRKIEALRRQLQSSTAQITRVSYGALPDGSLTEEQRYRGRILQQTVGQVCRGSARQYLWCLLLFKLVRALPPTVCLEMGTSLGISGAYQAAALKVNQRGRLVTLEGDASLASYAGAHFHALGLDNVQVVVGRFQETLAGVLHTHGPFEFAYFDGDHDEEATLRYFAQVCPFLARRAILVFDDISWSRGMARAWRAIAHDERVKIAVDLAAVGVAVIDCDLERQASLKVPLG